MTGGLDEGWQADCLPGGEYTMTNPLSNTAHDDAPLSAAKNPEPAERDVVREEVLVGRSVTINRPREELYAFMEVSPTSSPSGR